MVDFAIILENNRQQVNTALENYFCTFKNQQISLFQAMRYGVLLGGKKLRSFLVYQIGQMFGISSDNLNAPASAVECIHAYSLIHDDLPAMDNDSLRRGLPSCHIKFGETTAILAGDALQALAFSILADAKMPKVSIQNRLRMISTLATASGANGMCLGQALDLEIQEHYMSTAHLETIYQHKTAALIRAAVQMGIAAADECDSLVSEYLDRFATTIGLAFQIQDDFIDNNIADSQTFTPGYNTSEHKLYKSNYTSLFGLDATHLKAQNLCQESLVYLGYIANLGYDTTMLVNLAHYITERET